MKLLDIKSLHLTHESLKDKEIKVGGWVRSVRDSKNFGFIDLNDGTSFKGVQIVFTPENCSNYQEVAKLNAGSSVICAGNIVETPNNKQPYEIHAKSIEIVCATTNDYPLQKKGHTMEFLREQAYLRPRTNLFNAVFRVRSESAFALHRFFNSEGFVYVHAGCRHGQNDSGRK